MPKGGRDVTSTLASALNERAGTQPSSGEHKRAALSFKRRPPLPPGSRARRDGCGDAPAGMSDPVSPTSPVAEPHRGARFARCHSGRAVVVPGNIGVKHGRARRKNKAAVAGSARLLTFSMRKLHFGTDRSAYTPPDSDTEMQESCLGNQKWLHTRKPVNHGGSRAQFTASPASEKVTRKTGAPSGGIAMVRIARQPSRRPCLGSWARTTAISSGRVHRRPAGGRGMQDVGRGLAC